MKSARPPQPDPDGTPSEPLLDRQNVLQLFHISVRTLQKWRSKHILPYIRIGNKIYYRQSDIDDMLEKNRRGT